MSTSAGTELRLVMASANPHKVEEIRSLLQRLVRGVSVAPRPAGVPDVVEDADSLVGNARLKGRALCEATGMAAVADDTGLFVDALDGRPGVRSARFAHEHATDSENVVYLLALLAEAGAVEAHHRAASFRTVAIVCFPDGTELIGNGRIDGTIAHSPTGTRGFGYDPVFCPTDLPADWSDRTDSGGSADPRPTFAQLTADQKNSLSHRARAFADLARQLQAVQAAQAVQAVQAVKAVRSSPTPS